MFLKENSSQLVISKYFNEAVSGSDNLKSFKWILSNLALKIILRIFFSSSLATLESKILLILSKLGKSRFLIAISPTDKSARSIKPLSYIP